MKILLRLVYILHCALCFTVVRPFGTLVQGTSILFDLYVEHDYSHVMGVAQWDGCDVIIVKEEVTRDVFHVTAQVEIGRLMRTVIGMWSPAGNAREREGNGKSLISLINAFYKLLSLRHPQLPE